MINNFKYYNLPAFKHLKYVSFGNGGGEDPTKWEYFHIKNEYAGDNTLIVSLSSVIFTSANTEYSFDKETWVQLKLNRTTNITMTEGATVYLRGTDWVRKINGQNPIFTCTENFSVGGCILSLLDYTNMKNITEIPEYFANNMFMDVEQILKADFNIGNATSVSERGFYCCFGGCTNLKTIPDFSNLTSVGECGFGECFSNCSSLTKSSDFSSLTTVGNFSFYHCFQNCVELNTTPNFSNVTSVDGGGFNYCFAGCSSLTTTPDFSNLTTVGDRGFTRCFYYCTNLNYVYAPSVSEWDFINFLDWLSEVPQTGTMSCPSGVEIDEGVSGIPSGWTRVDR